MQVLTLLVVVSLLGSCMALCKRGDVGGCVTPDSIPCTFFYNNTLYDFSRLASASGSFAFRNDTGAHPIPQYGNQSAANYELQICQNIQTSVFGCPASASPSYVINITTGACASAGDITAYSWDPNPENDGVSLTYYHGDLVPGSVVGERYTRIYFLCPGLTSEPVTDSTTPVYEHYVPERYEYHYYFATNYACWYNYSRSTNPTTTTTTTTGGTPQPSFSCTTTFANGTQIDLSPLFATNGSYHFANAVGSRNQAPANYDIQICGPVKSGSGCPAGAAATLTNTTTGECISVGDASVYSWGYNPSSDGVYLTYYHGSAVDRVFYYESRIYFECEPGVDARHAALTYEFENTDFDQFHFIIYSKYACASGAGAFVPSVALVAVVVALVAFVMA